LRLFRRNNNVQINLLITILKRMIESVNLNSTQASAYADTVTVVQWPIKFTNIIDFVGL